MLRAFFNKISFIFRDATLRRRILFVLAALVVFRVFAAIPIPGVDAAALAQFFANNQFLGLLNVFSGGGLANLSIVMLGVAPYITASIIMQLMTIMSPKIKALYQEEGEAGRRKFMQYARLLTVPLAVGQAFAFLSLLSQQGVVSHLTTFDLVANIVVIAAGSILLMWIGELITEFGIGNGVSLIIFAGIVAGLPATASQLAFGFDVSQLPLYLGFALAALLVIAGVVAVTEAERPIPVTYAKQARGGRQSGGVSTYLPLRLNQAGVIPIIFALSLLLFPQMLFRFVASVAPASAAGILDAIGTFFSTGVIYASVYFAMVFLFTYFYTAVTFDPDSVANNLQKSGAFIPGVRPGRQTAEYIGTVLTRITLVGATFLGIVAVLPLAMQAVTGITAFAIGGTALLIVVSVVLDLIKRIDSQISMRHY